MTINNQEILGILESHNPNTKLSAIIQRRQDQIKYIMEQENLSQTKDLITIAQDFKGLTNLDENELKTKYNIVKIEELKRTYPDFELSVEDGDIHATLASYEGKTIPEFPSGLKFLSIWSCPNLEAIPEFPSRLESLYIWDCPKIESVAELPCGLKELFVSRCENLKLLPELPSSFERLNIVGCPNLEAIPEFPSSLKSLVIGDCRTIESVAELPCGLKELVVSCCENLKLLPEFPSGLERLEFVGCPNLTQENLDRIEEFNKKQS